MYERRFTAAAVVVLTLPAFAGRSPGSGPQIAPEERTPRALKEVLARAAKIRALHQDKRLGDLGILDITRPPYSADPSGRTDATDAIQRSFGFAGSKTARTSCWLTSSISCSRKARPHRLGTW